MKKYLYILTTLALLMLSGWAFLGFGTGKGFREYLSLGEYRRMHPELLPSTMLVRAFDAGHTTSYASFKWMELIQFIGNNISNNRYIEFTDTLIGHIANLHPYFEKPYEINLILTPIGKPGGREPTREEQEQYRRYHTNAIALGKRGIERLCDAKKIALIQDIPMGESLWNRSDLKNPCVTGMLPYYLAFVIYQTQSDKKDATLYYKIASMNDDAPIASRTLGVIAEAANGEHRKSALTFFLIGQDGYDEEPYTCRAIATSLARETPNVTLDLDAIAKLEALDTSLTPPKDKDNPMSQSTTNCYEMTTRGISELYRTYITGKSQGSAATTGDALVQEGRLEKIPTLQSRKNTTVIKENGIWEYRVRAD